MRRKLIVLFNALDKAVSKVQLLVICILAVLLTICLSVFNESGQVYFSPNGGCQEAIVSEISKARKNIDIAVYYLTSREIAQELVTAKDRGVKARIVLDVSQETQEYSKSRFLIKQGFEVKYYTGQGLMHNKFAIIDGKVLITGSFNWTPTADYKNEENLLIMSNKGLIKKYAERFEYLWDISRLAD